MSKHHEGEANDSRTMDDIPGSSSFPSGLVDLFAEEIALDGFPEISVDSTLAALDSELGAMASRFLQRINEENWKGRGVYYSDVFACESAQRASDLCREFNRRGNTYPRRLLIVVRHGNHVHTLHDCPYSNKSCRCNFKNFPEAQDDLRRLLRKPRAIETLQKHDWENIAKYFLKEGREPTFLKIGHTIEKYDPQNADIPNIGIQSEIGNGEGSGLEMCRDPIDDGDGGKRSIASKSDGSTTSRGKRRKIAIGGERGLFGVANDMLQLISTYAIVPLSEIVHTKEWIESSFAASRLDDINVKNILDARASQINLWKRADFKRFYDNPKTIKIWSARYVDSFDTYYLTYEESQNIIKQLLQFQLGDRVNEFCFNLVNILDRNLPKRNNFTIISPPSAGKNFFIDAVLDYFLNSGQMCNPNKYNNFAYQGCYNKRIILWNEPNYEPREIENLKLLFGGDNLSANVKCKPQANIKRTPIIVLTNTSVNYLNHPAFKDRIYTYRWHQAPFLAQVKKKPRPDAVIDLVYDLSNMYALE